MARRFWLASVVALLIGMMLAGRTMATPKLPGVFIEGTIISADSDTISVKLHGKKGATGKTTVKMTDSTAITLDGSTATVDDLKPGMKVVVHDLGGKAAEVEAHSEKKKGK